ncbi:MAG: methyltransferase [Candidatus Thermoplasmatota archaeon]|nr:methyltransferase [Candidatus Thermoplasmatota archaeon]
MEYGMKVRNHSIELETMETVYRPAEDTRLLMECIEPGRTTLEIGCGTGAVSILCAMEGSLVTAVDINPDAVSLTERNARRNSVRVNPLVSDLFGSVSGRYDTIAFNPPYLPAMDSIPGSEQWNGGKDGFMVTRPFLERVPDFLVPGGNVFIILSSLTDVDSLVREFRNLEFALAGEIAFEFERIYCYRLLEAGTKLR